MLPHIANVYKCWGRVALDVKKWGAELSAAGRERRGC
jgi:hypothetical protein